MIIVAYQYDLAICKVQQVVHHTERGESRWDLAFHEEVTDFSPSLEVGLSSTSADELGELRARPRVLVDATRIAALRAQGRSWREITVATGISKGTAQWVLSGLPRNV